MPAGMPLSGGDTPLAFNKRREDARREQSAVVACHAARDGRDRKLLNQAIVRKKAIVTDAMIDSYSGSSRADGRLAAGNDDAFPIAA